MKWNHLFRNKLTWTLLQVKRFLTRWVWPFLIGLALRRKDETKSLFFRIQIMEYHHPDEHCRMDQVIFSKVHAIGGFNIHWKINCCRVLHGVGCVVVDCEYGVSLLLCIRRCHERRLRMQNRQAEKRLITSLFNVKFY